MKWSDDLEVAIDASDASAVFVVTLPRLRAMQIRLGVPGMQHLANVLVERVWQRLEQAHCERPFVRFEGLELIVIVPGLARLGGIAELGEAIRNICNQPIGYGGDRVGLDSAVGIAISPDNGRKASDLIAKAQIAADNASLTHTTGPIFFTAAMSDAVDVSCKLEMELRQALHDKALSIAFQPQFDLDLRRFTAVEVLARWEHPIFGSIAPGDFIPVAEAAGLMPGLGTFVIEEAIAQLQPFNSKYPSLALAVNVSPTQLMKDDFVFEIEDLLASVGMNGEGLVIEITEGELLYNIDIAIERLADLRRLGVKTAIDDFGAGFSNLAYLHKLPLDQIKIDRRFVQQLFEGSRASTLLQSAIQLGHGLDLEVCVEGVETRDQLAIVEELGGDLVQGFIFAKPTQIAQLGEATAFPPRGSSNPLIERRRRATDRVKLSA